VRSIRRSTPGIEAARKSSVDEAMCASGAVAENSVMATTSVDDDSVSIRSTASPAIVPVAGRSALLAPVAA